MRTNTLRWGMITALFITLALALGAVAVLPAGARANATLNPAHVGATNPGFSTGSCPTPPAGQEGWYGWHFIMPGNENFLSLSVTFQNAGTISADPFPGVFVAHPDNSHAYIWTPGPDTLLGGTATSSGSQTSFNLSHVCTPPYQPLTATKTAAGTYDRTITWTLDKSVDDNEHSGTAGQFAGSSLWTVVVNKTETLGNYQVTGSITINNPNGYPVDFSVSDSLGGTVACPAYQVPAYGSIVCSYAVSPGSQVGQNTATIRVSGKPDVVASATIGWTEKLIGYPTVNVVDAAEAEVWLGTASGYAVFQYTRDFTCPANPALYVNGMYSFSRVNTASIEETGQSDTETVTVNCTLPALQVSKTAAGTYDRTVTWTLDKSVDDDYHSGYAGQTAGSSTWTVVADKTETFGNYKVTGSISVYNPAAISQTFSVSDMLSDGTVASVSCDMTTIPAGDTATCTYEAFPADGSATLNTATVSALGNADKTATASVSFTGKLIGYDEGTLSDPRFGYSELISGDMTETFPESFACSSEPSDYGNDGHYQYTVTNWAYLNGNLNLSDSETVIVDCTLPALQVSKTAAGTYDRTVTWTLEKSVDPASHSGFAGDEFESTWTVDADKTDSGPYNFAVNGTITIYNPAAIGQTILAIQDTLNDGATPAEATQATVTCPSDTVPAGQSITCTYIAMPDDATATRNHVAVKALGNAAQTARADVLWTENLNGYDGGTLSDERFDYSEPISGDTTKTFDETFTCPTDPSLYEGDGIHEFTVTNTAILNGNINKEASAEVTVTCYAPVVDKTADATHTRTWNWTIDKVAGQSELMLDPYTAATVNYSVTVNATYTDVWEVSGDITVVNPAPMEMVVTLVDVLDDGTPVTITCEPDALLVDDQLTIPANTTAACSYIAYPDDSSATLNTATATLNAIDFVATADVVFENVEIDQCIDVSDTNVGFLGTVCADEELPKTFTYSLVFGLKWEAPYTDVVEDVELECGFTRHPNTASFVTNDTGTTGSDNWTIDITIDCGCTLTRGYWQTHSAYGPAPYDPIWAMIGEDTLFFLSGQTYYEVMQTSPGGNAYYILAPQYIAAKLNILNGAYAPPDVKAAMARAEGLFNQYTPAQVAKLKGADLNEFKMLGDLLDRYNNGYYGPLHCD